MGQKSTGGKRLGAGRPKEVKKERFPITQEEKQMILRLRGKTELPPLEIIKKPVKVATEINQPKKSLKELLKEIK